LFLFAIGIFNNHRLWVDKETTDFDLVLRDLI